MRARVVNGRWVLDDAADLPEGTVVEIVTRPVAAESVVYIDEKIVAYALAVAVASGGDAPRQQRLIEEAKANALRANRRYVTPEDVKAAATAVITGPEGFVRKILDETPVP
jgi:MoxR-like ATPase